MIKVTETISINEADIVVNFVQASGPGGQNVNKTASQVQLRYNPVALPEEVRSRLRRVAGSRMLEDGTLLIQASRYRTQEQNRQDALERLVALVRQAAHRPRPRRPTRPTLASQQRRLEQKKQRGMIKRMRRGAEEE